MRPDGSSGPVSSTRRFQPGRRARRHGESGWDGAAVGRDNAGNRWANAPRAWESSTLRRSARTGNSSSRQARMGLPGCGMTAETTGGSRERVSTPRHSTVTGPRDASTSDFGPGRKGFECARREGRCSDGDDSAERRARLTEGDGKSRVWDAASASQSRCSFTPICTSAAFSRRREVRGDAGERRTARVWEAIAGGLLNVLRGHRGRSGVPLIQPARRSTRDHLRATTGQLRRYTCDACLRHERARRLGNWTDEELKGEDPDLIRLPGNARQATRTCGRLAAPDLVGVSLPGAPAGTEPQSGATSQAVDCVSFSTEPPSLFMT